MTVLSILLAVLLAVGLMAIAREVFTRELHLTASHDKDAIVVTGISIALSAMMDVLTAFFMLNPAHHQSGLKIVATIGLISACGFLIAALISGIRSRSWVAMLLTLAVYTKAYGLSHPASTSEANQASVIFALSACGFVVFQIIGANKASKRAAQEELRRSTAHIRLGPVPCNQDPDLWVKHGHHLEPGKSNPTAD